MAEKKRKRRVGRPSDTGHKRGAVLSVRLTKKQKADLLRMFGSSRDLRDFLITVMSKEEIGVGVNYYRAHISEDAKNREGAVLNVERDRN